jgi:hypothetical protein
MEQLARQIQELAGGGPCVAASFLEGNQVADQVRPTQLSVLEALVSHPAVADHDPREVAAEDLLQHISGAAGGDAVDADPLRGGHPEPPLLECELPAGLIGMEHGLGAELSAQLLVGAGEGRRGAHADAVDLADRNFDPEKQMEDPPDLTPGETHHAGEEDDQGLGRAAEEAAGGSRGLSFGRLAAVGAADAPAADFGPASPLAGPQPFHLLPAACHDGPGGGHGKPGVAALAVLGERVEHLVHGLRGQQAAAMPRVAELPTRPATPGSAAAGPPAAGRQVVRGGGPRAVDGGLTHPSRQLSPLLLDLGELLTERPQGVQKPRYDQSEPLDSLDQVVEQPGDAPNEVQTVAAVQAIVPGARRHEHASRDSTIGKLAPVPTHCFARDRPPVQAHLRAGGVGEQIRSHERPRRRSGKFICRRPAEPGSRGG